MNGKTYPYLDLVALAAVGEALLDWRAAMVFCEDGGRLLWANQAAMTLFGEERLDALLDRRFSTLNPLRSQLARLARVLPAEASRLEILRIGQGVSYASVPASCRKLGLAGGGSAILAVAAGAGSAESLATRAERLADAIAGGNCLAAVLDRDGRVLGASGGFDELASAEADIDQMIEEARGVPAGTVKRRLQTGDGERPAGAVAFSAEGRQCFLVIVGPVEAARAAPVLAASAERQADLSPPGVAAPAQPLPVAEAGAPSEEPPTTPPAPVRRFAFAIDAEGTITVATGELAEAVGAENAAIAGLGWNAVADTLDLDPDGAIARALSDREPWSHRVLWPAENGEAVAIELTAFPDATDGFRGFGFCHLGERGPDRRATPRRLADLAIASETPPVADAEPAQVAEPEAEKPAAVEAPPTEAVAAAAEAPPAEPPPTVDPRDINLDLDDLARKTIEEGRLIRAGSEPAAAQPAPPLPEPPAPPLPSNIVRLPSSGRTLPERLTGTEQDAFRRIAETLGARQAEAAAPPAEPERPETPSTVPPPPRREIVTVPASEIDARLLDRLPIGLVVFRDGKTLFANRMMLDLVGHDSLAAFVDAGGAESIFPGGAEAWAGGIAEHGGRLAARRRDGESVPVQVRLHAVPWGANTALMLSLLPRSERSEQEAAAGHARVLELEAILDTATDGVIVVDRDGRIGSMNRAGEALFGVEGREWVGRPFTDLLAEESHKSALDYLDGLAANGVASVLNDGREVIGRVPAGGLIPLFMTMGRIGQSDKFCAVLRDITHWKNVEEELVAARRSAETANAQKSDFLAKISHEIRTPLNAIIGFSEVMMEERFGPIGNDRYRSYLRDIHVSGAHLMSLINDLLDLSKIEAGKLELAFEAVGVNGAIQECVALMQPQANRERIIIRTSLGADVPDVVADPRSFRQILLNLLSNAVKFTRAGGQVIVSSALEESGEVVVRIRDTGVGMSEKDIETALKPFRQLVTAKGGEQRGTGLGLPLTKALVEANRATFSIDSAIEQGTLVRITFPTTRVLAG